MLVAWSMPATTPIDAPQTIADMLLMLDLTAMHNVCHSEITEGTEGSANP
jgi:hypothetical protein